MKQTTSVIAAIGILTLAALGIYLAFVEGWRVVSGAEPNVAAALIAVSGTVIVSAFSVAGSRLLENRARIAEEHRARKAPVYQELQEFFAKVLFATRMGEEPPTDEETVKFFAEFAPRLTVWGSNEAIRAFVDFRKRAGEIGQQAPQGGAVAILFLYEQLILKLRSDLGHSNVGLQPGDLVSVLVSDIENLPRPAA